MAESTWLDDYLWKNRLVILSPGTHQQMSEQQRALLQLHSEGLKDRDVVVLEPKSKEQRDSLNLRSEDFTVLLVGKDGTVKLRSRELVHPRDLFELIDQMPMRRREMRDR